MAARSRVVVERPEEETAEQSVRLGEVGDRHDRVLQRRDGALDVPDRQTQPRPTEWCLPHLLRASLSAPGERAITSWRRPAGCRMRIPWRAGTAVSDSRWFPPPGTAVEPFDPAACCACTAHGGAAPRAVGTAPPQPPGRSHVQSLQPVSGSQAAVLTESSSTTKMSSLSLLRETAVTGARAGARPPLMSDHSRQPRMSGLHAAVLMIPPASVTKMSSLSLLRETACTGAPAGTLISPIRRQSRQPPMS